MLTERVSEALTKIAFSTDLNTKIVIGFSGGADSVCLLDILSKFGFQIQIAYFNHQLRSAVDNEMQFVLRTAEKYKIDYLIGSKNISLLAKKTHIGIEEAARFYRYKYLMQAAEDINARGVFIAHHADDQIETMLMNLIRGSGMNGLAGMESISFSEFNDSIPIVRPLLGIWKQEILAYCAENNLSYMVDESNQETIYTRNRIRKELIPTLEKYNPNIKKGLLRTGTILKDDLVYLNQTARDKIDGLFIRSKMGLVELDIQLFRNESVSIQRIMINNLLHDHFNMSNNLSFNLIENIRHVLCGDTASKYSKCTDDLQVLVEKRSGFIFSNINLLEESNGLFLSRENTSITMPGKTMVNDNWCIFCGRFSIEEIVDIYDSNQDHYLAFIDANTVSDQLVLQKWQPGMRYAPLGMGKHSMKLTDFWINKSFPKRKREIWPLVISDGEVIWVPGFQPAFSARITPSTKNVWKLSVQRSDLD